MGIALEAFFLYVGISAFMITRNLNPGLVSPLDFVKSPATVKASGLSGFTIRRVRC